MKKKITVIIIVLTIVSLSVYLCYLQFGRNMDVMNSMTLNSNNYKQERINVILNKLIIDDTKEEIAKSIIQKVIDNDFHTIKFNLDNGYPNELNVSVYKTEQNIKTNNILFSFSYKQIDGEIGQYDISQPEHMKLEIQ